MRKIIMSSFLIAAMFGFTGCDTRAPMTEQERVAFEQNIKYANKDGLKQEYLIAYANNDSEKLAYFTNEVLLPGDKLAQENLWNEQKKALDKVLFEISAGTQTPTKLEVQMLISQLKNPQSLRFDYVREVLLPELSKTLEEL